MLTEIAGLEEELNKCPSLLHRAAYCRDIAKVLLVKKAYSTKTQEVSLTQLLTLVDDQLFRFLQSDDQDLHRLMEFEEDPADFQKQVIREVNRLVEGNTTLSQEQLLRCSAYLAVLSANFVRWS